jgi:cytochrome P450
MYKILTFFGNNIVTSEGEEWKKYRKPAAPSFSDRNNKLVWDETTRIMLDLFENIWAAQDTIFADHALNITFQVSKMLHLIHFSSNICLHRLPCTS